MPEGDTIFRAARALGRALGGKTITGFRSAYPLLTRYHDDHPLTGQTVEGVESRGKWVLMHFSGGATLATHMLMNGSWHIYRPGERWQKRPADARIVIENKEYVAVGFNVPVAEMHTAQTLARDKRIPAPKGDLLSADFDPEAAYERMTAQPDEELGDVLLRQRVIAGVGNEFKSEICFVTGLNPFRKMRTLTEAEVRGVIAVAGKQLRENVLEDSPDTVVTRRGVGRRTTHNTDPRERVWVYGRKGLPCRKCGTLIEGRPQGVDARVTYWCPECQKYRD